VCVCTRGHFFYTLKRIDGFLRHSDFRERAILLQRYRISLQTVAFYVTTGGADIFVRSLTYVRVQRS